MPRHFHPKLVFAVVATASFVTATAFAQTASHATEAPPPPVPVATDSLSTQDREMLSMAEQLANDASQILDQWVTTQAVSQDRLFSRLYFPIPKTDPQKWTTPYDSLADRDIVGIEDKVLARSPAVQYAILTDVNGYVPAHNSRFAQVLTGNMAQDYINNRTKRLLGDTASVVAGRNETHYLIQRTRNETGDVITDLSVPVNVRGKHWGCVRIGYRRTE